MQRLTAEAKSWKDHISTREAEERLLNSPIAKIHSFGAGTGAGGKAIHPMAKSVLDFHGANFKGLAAAGRCLTPQSFAATPVREGELPATIRDLITATQISGTDRFAFLRQTGRTNRATTVARGALKPSSDYEITRVEDRCRTVAHLSTPIQRQDLDDATTLQEFVSAELVYGLGQAVEDQLLNGNTDHQRQPRRHDRAAAHQQRGRAGLGHEPAHHHAEGRHRAAEPRERAVGVGDEPD